MSLADVKIKHELSLTKAKSANPTRVSHFVGLVVFVITTRLSYTDIITIYKVIELYCPSLLLHHFDPLPKMPTNLLVLGVGGLGTAILTSLSKLAPPSVEVTVLLRPSTLVFPSLPKQKNSLTSAPSPSPPPLQHHYLFHPN
jgi:hypothetical protein